MPDIETTAPEGAAHVVPLPNGADPQPPRDDDRTVDSGLVVVLHPHRPPIRRYSHDFVEKVHAAVEGETTPIVTLAERFGIGQGTIRNWIMKYDWTRPYGAPELQGPRRRHAGEERRRNLVARLNRAFGKQLARLEKRAADAADGQSLEKDARTLGVLAKTLATLIELDRDGAKVGEPERMHRDDLDELDSDLARRIEAWARSGEDN